MGRQAPRPIALDTGALLALESPRGRALLRRHEKCGRSFVVSAGALAQAWRDPRGQALLSRLVVHQRTIICPLDLPAAKACGRLLASRSTSDVIAGHVVLTAREHQASVIVTGDMSDLAHLDPGANLERI